MMEQQPIRMKKESLAVYADAPALYSHSVPEISMVLSGSGVHCILGQEIPCKAGDLYIVNADVVHGYQPSEEGFSVRRVPFDPKEWLEERYADPAAGCYCYGVFGDNAAVAYAMLTAKTRTEVRALIDAITRERGEERHEWKSAPISLCF